MLKKLFAKGLVKEIKENGIIVGAVASTGSLDREGDILEPGGWVLDNFRTAPRLLWSHMAQELPIGKVKNIIVNAMGDLVFDAEFAEKENDFAKKVADLVRGGFLNTFSVGFMPIEQDGQRYLKNELLEISMVNVPANPEARLSMEYKSFEAEMEKMDQYHMKPEPDVTENYIRIRVEDPDKFVDDSFRTITISAADRIKAVIGKYKTDPTGPTHVQSYLFDKDKWTVSEAQAWVDEHAKEFTDIDFENVEEIIAIIEAKKIKKIVEKDGRIISEKNRSLIRTCVEAMKQSISALEDLLASTEPAPKEAIGTQNKVETRKASRHLRMLKALRLVDKAVEFAIHQSKEE